MSKEEVKKKGFYLLLFNKIKQGYSPSVISKQYKIPKQNLNYYLKNLKKWGVIEKIGYNSWRVKVKTFSLGTKPTTNLHALQIKIPISKGNIGVKGWVIKEKLKNWTPTYKTFNQLGGITIKNNNNKSITLFAHSRDIRDLKEIDALAYDMRNWALQTIREEFGAELDINRAEVKSLHIATNDTNAESMQKKGEKFELDLEKKAEKVFPPDNINAKAWIDGSPFDFTAETNDKEWKRAYLNMPFNMQNTLQAVYYIAQNYKSHVKVVEQLSKLLEEKEVKKQLKKKLKDRNLNEWN